MKIEFVRGLIFKEKELELGKVTSKINKDVGAIIIMMSGIMLMLLGKGIIILPDIFKLIFMELALVGLLIIFCIRIEVRK